MPLGPLGLSRPYFSFGFSLCQAGYSLCFPVPRVPHLLIRRNFLCKALGDPQMKGMAAELGQTVLMYTIISAIYVAGKCN